MKKTDLSWCLLVRLSVVGGVGTRSQGSVAWVGEAAAQRAAAGRRLCGGEQARALQSCRRQTALAQEVQLWPAQASAQHACSVRKKKKAVTPTDL